MRLFPSVSVNSYWSPCCRSALEISSLLNPLNAALFSECKKEMRRENDNILGQIEECDEGGLAIAPRPAIGGHAIRGQLHEISGLVERRMQLHLSAITADLYNSFLSYGCAFAPFPPAPRTPLCQYVPTTIPL